MIIQRYFSPPHEESTKMKFGLIDARELVEFPYSHGGAFKEVADSTDTHVTAANPPGRKMGFRLNIEE
jgi:hypothetical protein